VIRRRDLALILAVLAIGYCLVAVAGHAAYVSVTHSLRALTTR
jgi:hypothetical protein